MADIKQFLDAAGGQEIVKLLLQAMATSLADYMKTNELTGQVEDLFDVEYKSADKKIYFKMGETPIGEIDATDFILDKALEDVEITDGSGTNDGKEVIKFTFNTDAGSKTIEVPVGKIFDKANYYTKTEVDGKVKDITDDIDEIKEAVGLGEGGGEGESISDRLDSLEEDFENLEQDLEDNYETQEEAEAKYVQIENLQAVPVETIRSWFTA